MHQVNLEFLSEVVANRDGTLLPDTVIGTDSHTTMVEIVVLSCVLRYLIPSP